MKTGRIIKSISGVYRVDVNGETYDTKPRGLFRKQKITPVVGDIVDFEIENECEGYIYHVHERKNSLKRPPVSNIDHVIIVMSAVEPMFSTQLLDRFLVIAHSYNLNPQILITKKDLATADMLVHIEQYIATYREMGYPVHLIGKDDDVSDVVHAWGEGVIVLSGQSGVGKSTLLNQYLPELNLETNIISKSLNRGKHTTRHVQLYETSQGFIADTPGFSALDFDHIQKEMLKHYFKDLDHYSALCKFRDCDHINEPKCNVKKALAEGDIAQFRYDHYIQLYEEIAKRKERY